MHKYYILIQSNYGMWAIQSDLNEDWYASQGETYLKSLLEASIPQYSINNCRESETSNEISRMKKVIISRGLSYPSAEKLLNEIEEYQTNDLKLINKKYVREHTVKLRIISKYQALGMISSIPINNHKHKNKGYIEGHRNSARFRRLAKSITHNRPIIRRLF